MSQPENEDAQRIKARERLIELDVDRYLTLTLDLFKWVMAATLSVNGAPLIAMLSSDKLRPYLAGPGIAFAVGLSLSILGNLLLIKGLAQAGEKLFAEHWTGEAVKKDSYDDVAEGSDTNIWTVGASILLGLSLASFLTGIVWLGSTLEVK